MRNLTFKAACRALYDLSRRGKLALLVHARPDGDCIGSAYATAVLLEAVGCHAHVVCADPLPARLRFIAEAAKQDGNITLDTIPEDFQPGRVTAVALDIAASTQLGCLEGKYDIALSFDHHARSTAFCDRYLSADASATGEIVWRIAREWLRMGFLDSIPEGIAPAIYAAISSDTGCFRYSNVTPATHRTAAQLIALIPAFILVSLAAICIFTSPTLNPYFVYLYAWQYALIFIGMFLLVWRVNRKQVKRLFGESVKKSLKGGDAQ